MVILYFLKSSIQVINMKNIFDRIFNRWTKWEIYQEDQPYIETTHASPILGSYVISTKKVRVDVYCRENKYTGIKQYKKVVK